MNLNRLLAGAAAAILPFAIGCMGVSSTVRYGTDGQAEYFVDCSGSPMTRCYERALQNCPEGYFLVKEDQVPEGTKSGSIFGGAKHIGGVSGSQKTTWKNQLVVRCK